MISPLQKHFIHFDENLRFYLERKKGERKKEWIEKGFQQPNLKILVLRLLVNSNEKAHV